MDTQAAQLQPSPTTSTSNQFIPNDFQEVELKEFEDQIRGAKEIGSSMIKFDCDQIASIAMNNCITIFIVEVDSSTGQVEDILGFHVDDSSTADDIYHKFLTLPNGNNQAHIYLIGGNQHSFQKGNLRDEIYGALDMRYGNHDQCIYEERLGLIDENPNYTYISAALNKEGSLIWCYHK